MGKFRHTPDMGEISGFGGGYEECCQDMLEAGVNWLHERDAANEKTNLEAHSFRNVTGIFIVDSDDAKALEKAVVDASKGKATGAMHHVVMQRLFVIAKKGWDWYCDELRKKEKADGSPASV